MTSVAHSWCARLALFVSIVTACYAGPPKPYGELLQLGKEAYLEEDYQSCASILLDAIEQHKQFQQLLLDCREKCESQAAGETLLTSVDTDVQLHVFERLIRETHCLVQCQKQRLGAQLENYLDSGWADEDFRLRKPYDYLQLCFFKTGQLQKAANAVFTVLEMRPNDVVMKENLQYYTGLEGVDSDAITSMAPQEHLELYMRGNQAYEAGKFAEMVRYMEDALDSYVEAERRCRSLCERFFRQGYNPDFVANVANHFAYVLRCKLRCPDELAMVAGNYLPDHLVSHYHYLQFGYFKRNMVREACSNAASYLLFKPLDADMLSNKRLYLKQEGVDDSMFVPRAEALEIFERTEREQKLDDYILEKFRFSDDDPAKKKGEPESS